MSTLIFDHRKVLGEGDYGTVFEGKWRGIPVAVKRVPHQCLNSGNERELKALQSLNHPNVIKLLHSESVEYFRFYVLELCEASLDQLFLKDDDPRKYRGQMPQEIEVLHQLAIGLEYIHQMKLIHRNIKPEHFLIWVNPVNNEVVMKWSGFESITEANERGTCSMSGIRGTTSWLAPEILKLLDDGEANETKVKQRGTFKSDVFAEGLVFGYFLLKGLHLFGSRMQIKTNIIKNESVNLFKIQTKKVRDLITKMLKKNPGERISSSDVVEQLKQILEKEKINYLGPHQPSCSVKTQSSNEIKLDKDTILGRGDYGKIFRGEWNNKLVAVKLIKLNKIKKYNQEEELILKRLDHPNVVKFLHIENDSEYRYYALELCCASLDQVFLKNGDHAKYLELMPPAKDFFYQLAIGLDYIHKTGLIHRDIKPQNVLIWMNSTTKEVLIKWTGFGLSKVDEKIKNNNSVFDWLAPELLKLLDKGDFDTLPTVKSDVFAQGLVFGYYLLRGEHLFGSSVKAASNIMANEPANLQKIKNYANRELIKKILEPNPEKRMTSSDVAKELEQIRAKGRQYPLVSSKDDNTPSLKQIKIDVNKILGSGGYGIVFQGEWNKNQVAVKQIPLSKVESNKREEEALQMLNHPNVIKLFHAESGSENRYYAIELCAASLDKLFFSDESAKKYRGPMPSQKAVLLQLATGLEYIHEKKVIHRDITPKNILIWVNPENSKQVLLKWADFGLSKQIGKSETYTVSKVRGAEGWLAPEILEILDNQQQTSRTEAKQRGTIKSDVFNQGLVFGYYLLKGRHLFGGLPEPNIYRDKPVNLDKIEWEIGRELIKKMIHPNPRKRISSSDVTQELRQMKFGPP